MPTFTLKPTEDVENNVGVWTVDGLDHPFLKGRTATVTVNAGDEFKDVVYEIRSQYKNVAHGDIFVTPTGKWAIDGAMVTPYEDPPPPADPATDPAATNQQATAGQPGPVQPVPVMATDSLGRALGGSIDIPWPGATTSEIVAAWDVAAKSATPGNALNTIKVPGTQKRIVLIGYNDDQTQVLLDVG